ncbi:hypothetical protein BN000_04313 [Neobacillus massiliamazoniensis]|uniref:Uncharacterized protein n=1 Tax=Neobacillus massiliamazoniensis TaxID=1499688 RepID=A0A0U1P248_9BACI|nr:hypothetical protein BN000_04313 [Neobacillus massiliamazoniensis]
MEPSQITIDGHPAAYFSITNIDTNIIPGKNKHQFFSKWD